MIHLSKKNGRFYVAIISPNHEVVLNSQPIGFAARKGAQKNIRAGMKAFNSTGRILVQDNTGEKPVVKWYHEFGITEASQKPVKPWVPGVNKSSGKPAKLAKKSPVKKLTKKAAKKRA